MSDQRTPKCLLALGLLFILTASAQVETKSIKPITVPRKVALVIGNSKYQHIAGVPPATSDADDVAQTLRSLGFDSVDVRKDLTAHAMISEVARFTRSEIQATTSRTLRIRADFTKVASVSASRLRCDQNGRLPV